MRFSKSVFLVVVMTFFGVLYVTQEIEIIKTGYHLRKKEEMCQKFVDENSSLKYSMSKLESLGYIDREFLQKKEDEFHMTGTLRVAKLDSGKMGETGSAGARGTGVPPKNMFASVFNSFFDKQAEAKVSHKNSR